MGIKTFLAFAFFAVLIAGFAEAIELSGGMGVSVIAGDDFGSTNVNNINSGENNIDTNSNNNAYDKKDNKDNKGDQIIISAEIRPSIPASAESPFTLLKTSNPDNPESNKQNLAFLIVGLMLTAILAIILFSLLQVLNGKKGQQEDKAEEAEEVSKKNEKKRPRALKNAKITDEEIKESVEE